MKIEIKDAKLFIDDQEKKVEDLKTEILDSILDKAIKQEVTFILTDNTHPVYNFFRSLQTDTTPDSDFMKELKKLEEEKKLEEAKLNTASEPQLK